MKLRGYRGDDRALLTGRWPAGELLGLPMTNWPALAEPTTIEPPAGPDVELCVVSGVAFVRYTELDWVHRRARLEIGVAHERHTDAVDLLVKLAVTHGFVSLNLRRLHGWVTPAARQATQALESAGFLREASVPDSGWLDGPVEREIWGAVRHD